MSVLQEEHRELFLESFLRFRIENMRFFGFFVLAVYGLSRFPHSDISFESKLRKAMIYLK